MSGRLLYGLFFQQTVPILRINGRIDALQVLNLERQLQSFNRYSLAALGLVVNSNGGCLYQIDKLSKMLQKYKQINQIQIYTFATDQVLGEACRLLGVGDKTFAQPSSKIGQVSYSKPRLIFSDFLKSHGIKTSLVSTNPFAYKFVMNSAVLTSQQREKLDDHIQGQNSLMLVAPRGNTDMQTNIVFGHQALQIGLVDEIGTYEAVLLKQFPRARIMPTTSQSELQKLMNWANLLVKVWQSRGFLGLMALFLMKTIIKYSIIIYVWRQARKQRRLKENQEQSSLANATSLQESDGAVKQQKDSDQ